MLEKTRGIILRVTDYGDTSVVVHVFTERFGMQAYLVQGAKRPKSRFPISMMQSLQLLDLVVRHRPNANLQRLAEMKLAPPLLSIPFDVSKSCVALFLTEMLYRALRQQGPDEALYQFVFQVVSWMDSTAQLPGNFHLYALLHMTRFLGFHPGRPRANELFFDLRNGIYQSDEPIHPQYLADAYVSHWSELASSPIDALASLKITREQRRILLDKLIEYYQLHIDNFGEVKSRAILEEVLS